MSCIRNTYTHFGTDDVTYNNIEPNSRIESSGTGKVTINGKIGNKSVIQISGTGDLYINGHIDNDVMLKLSGTASVIFAKRPDQGVINSIQIAGSGSIKMPGGPTTIASSSSYSNGNYSFGGVNVNFGGSPHFNVNVTNNTSVWINGREVRSSSHIDREKDSGSSSAELRKLDADDVSDKAIGPSSHIDGEKDSRSSSAELCKSDKKDLSNPIAPGGPRM